MHRDSRSAPLRSFGSLLEAGAVYVAREDEQLPHEHRSLGAVVHGRLTAPSWGDTGKAKTADFFAAKGLLAAVLDTLRVDWSVEAAPEPFLHPGRSARVLAGWV